MNVSQFLVYEDVSYNRKQGPPDIRREKLITLGIALITRKKKYLPLCIKNALDAGVSKDEILRIVALIVGDESFLDCIIEVLRALGFKENNRQDSLLIFDDCKEA